MALSPEVVAALKTLKTREEIVEAWNYLRDLSNYLKRQAVAEAKLTGTLSVGSKVKWAGRSGRTHTGTVEKLNRTTATVVEEPLFNGLPSRWRVSITILKAA